ncbi:uncharacterized protein LOC122960884 [Acropora millepora]|uniref:uncharacterized protein LOC122960866 n=1 Tax=Acropora millepora TaxID=45264 RepID=UPI001CF5DA2E|nr:uncharacterized protein LOC122960866 [Acropora millepora]XP_044179334.1 uncharacterized protein LOC122960866 [Acropora millepora]XP_044179378.1 uncharacterized protein LOC122960884 [Acropora millepora]XP_044179379.1 uncharacterized protein LOC122960884 [Acropora millepora]
MKKNMAISLFYFLFVAITIPGMEAKPRKATNANLPFEFDASCSNNLAWQALHMAAAAACRGSTPTGGSGTHVNIVLARNPHVRKCCAELCRGAGAPICDAEVSIRGQVGKATQNGQVVGIFYNYGCNNLYASYGRNEPGAAQEEIMSNKNSGGYSFCCCRNN